MVVLNLRAGQFWPAGLMFDILDLSLMLKRGYKATLAQDKVYIV